jgi:tRNA (adenine57-N1/adenine58-N1)-methyltransferase
MVVETRVTEKDFRALPNRVWMERLLILLDRRGRKHAVRVDEPMARVQTIGTFESAKLLANIGRRIQVGTESLLVLRPSGRDFSDTMRRGAQILTPKDLAAILYEADVRAEAHVVEAGTGSGALTVALARAVGPNGHVVSYDVQEAALRTARTNATAAGLESIIEFRLDDIRKGVPDREVDSVVLDIEDPWSAVDPVFDSLRVCGYLAVFSPNMEQVKETVRAIKRRPFIAVRTIELIEREIEVREVGVRPSFAPLGHTGYLTFARKVLDTF